jgi:nitrate reductase NapAB chaperone NapD
MVITGSAIFIMPGTFDDVKKALEAFHEITYQAKSDSGTEIVVNMEVENPTELDRLCAKLKATIPHVVDITHIYMNVEEEVHKLIEQGGGE